MHCHRVLVVDDQCDVLELTSEVLEASGMRAVCAGNGKEALDVLRGMEQPPCVILLDVMMPIMDGLTFRNHQLRDPNLASIPVVVISAHADVPTAARNMKATAYARKPLDMDDLVSCVERTCGCHA